MQQVAQVIILNRDNNPVINRSYVKNSPDETLLQFQVFNSLDIIEQVLKQKLQEPVENDSLPYKSFTAPYLGFIHSVTLIENDYDIYAYITTLKVKIIVILKQKKTQEKINVSNLCKLLLNVYQSKQFALFGFSNIDKQVDQIINEFQTNQLQG